MSLFIAHSLHWQLFANMSKSSEEQELIIWYIVDVHECDMYILIFLPTHISFVTDFVIILF